MSAKRASAGGLLKGIVVETPATRRGSRYAWIPIEAFRHLSAGGLKLFTLLSSLHRPRKALALSAAECAASLGCCERSLPYWRRELEREGWLEAGRLTIWRPNRLRKGYRAKVDITKLAVMSPASLRAYVGVTFATLGRNELRPGGLHLLMGGPTLDPSPLCWNQGHLRARLGLL